MEPLAARYECRKRARRILIAAALIHVSLFVLQARWSLRALVNPYSSAAAKEMGPFAKAADSVGYYEWLRAPLIDRHFPRWHNPWPVGPAIIWAPAVGTVHLVLISLGSNSPWPANGFSPPYQLAIGGTTLALGLLSLTLTYRVARRFAGRAAAASSAALLTLGTPFVAYATVDVSMAHVPAAAALMLFVFLWLRTVGVTRPGRWVMIGCLVGLTSLMRWQLSTFAVLPALEAFWLMARTDGWRARIGVAVRLAAAAFASVIVFIPQLVAKQVVFGSPLGGLHRTAQNWLTPSLWAVLGSTDRSLFYWTPITLPALAGLIYLAARRRGPALAILVAVVVQIYTVSAMLGEQVYLGGAYGFRLLTETCILLAPGVAILLNLAGPQLVRPLAMGGGLLVAWNLLLVGVYRYAIRSGLGGSPNVVLDMILQYSLSRSTEVLGIVVVSGWLTYWMLEAFRHDGGRATLVIPSRTAHRLAA